TIVMLLSFGQSHAGRVNLLRETLRKVHLNLFVHFPIGALSQRNENPRIESIFTEQIPLQELRPASPSEAARAMLPTPLGDYSGGSRCWLAAARARNACVRREYPVSSNRLTHCRFCSRGGTEHSSRRAGIRKMVPSGFSSALSKTSPVSRCK